MVSWDVHIDENKLWNVVNDASGTQKAITDATNRIAHTANSLGAGFRTKKVHIKGKEVGGKQPRDVGSAQKMKRTFVGIVHPKNYAAMKDNHLHNTLLKSMRRG